jgi:hypothetical protein
MVRRICLYALAGIAALVFALSLPACGGYGHHRQKGKTQTSGGY